MIQRIAMRALIVQDGKVLIIREAATYGEGTQRGRYQLPGGRVEIGEHFADALRREIREETDLEVEIVKPIYVGEWRPVIKGTPNQIVGIFFLCEPTGTDVVLSAEHDAYKWVTPDEAKKIDVMKPDCEVIETYALTLD